MRLYLLAASVVVSFYIGFYALDLEWSELFVIHAGYPIMFATFAVFVWLLIPVFREFLSGFRLSRSSLLPLFAIVGCTAYLFILEPFGAKIIMDEPVLLGTSMSMHLDRTILVPSIANAYSGSFEVTLGYLDKRPYFHPFLISLLHDLTGFRAANGVILNVLLTPFFLTLVFFLGRKFSGAKAGILSVLLLTSLPLLVQNANGGHFEILNLLMITATMLLGCRFLEKPDARTLAPFCYSALLLAQTRYESILFVFPVGLVVLIGWQKARKVDLDWPTIVAPMLLVCFPMQFRVFSEKIAFWQLEDQARDSVVGLEYVSGNLADAGRYFFHFGQTHSNSVLLSAVGLTALALFAVYSAVNIRRIYANEPGPLAFLAFLGGVLVSFSLAMYYHWGSLVDPVASRFCLPLMMMAALAAPFMLKRWPTQLLSFSLLAAAYGAWFHTWDLDTKGLIESGIKTGAAIVACSFAVLAVIARKLSAENCLIAITLVFIAFVTTPVASNHRYSQTYTPATQYHFISDFLKDQPTNDTFFASRSPLSSILQKVASASIGNVRGNPDIIAQHILHKNYREYFAYQLIDVHTDTGEEFIRDKYDLGPDFELETVAEHRLVPRQIGRIVRFKPKNLDEYLEAARESAVQDPAQTETGL